MTSASRLVARVGATLLVAVGVLFMVGLYLELVEPQTWFLFTAPWIVLAFLAWRLSTRATPISIGVVIAFAAYTVLAIFGLSSGF